MFKDYYKILGISQQASFNEIKSAYRAMSIKWHPDKNPNQDVTSIMQDINEAYAILKNDEQRRRYDKEYRRFAVFYPQLVYKTKNYSENASSYTTWSYNYDVQDEDLKEDIRTARQYAQELVKEFLKSIKENSNIAVKGALKNMIPYIWVAIIIFIFSLIVRTCN